MATKVANPLINTTLRFAATELEEIQEFVVRAGVRRSDFFRNAILARVREADSFSRSVPEAIDQVELRVAKLHELVAHQAALIQTLVGASIAQVAGTVNYGALPATEVQHKIGESIRRALDNGPTIVQACVQQHPELQQAVSDLSNLTH